MILLDYCEKENINLNGKDVLYFPIDRRISISKDEMEAIDIMRKLTMGKTFREEIECCFDIFDPFKWESWENGGEITCGYDQLMNLMFRVYIDKPSILIIDHIEQNLHILVANYLIEVFNSNPLISQIIFTTYQENILKKVEDYIWKKI